MIRVLHTIDTTGPGGAETVFVSLAKGLDPARFVSFAAIRGPGWVCDVLRQNGMEPVFISSRGRFNLRYLYQLIRIVRRYKIDVIQSHLLGSAVYSSMVGLICGIPLVSTIHGFVDVSETERFMRLKIHLINLRARKIVFVSDHLRRHSLEQLGFCRRKSMTIYNGVDTAVFYPCRDDSFRKKLKVDPGQLLIGAVGNIRPAKGYDILVRAAKMVHEKCPEARFVVAGEGSGKAYEALLALRDSLGLRGVFFFAGFQGNAAKFYNNLDVFVLPSVSEGFSISTIEAMACGLPVVVTRSGGPEEIVSHGRNGFLVHSRDADVAAAVLRLAADRALRAELGKCAGRATGEKFSQNKMIRDYQEIIALQG